MEHKERFFIKFILLIGSCFSTYFLLAHTADLVIFSFDRPLQLYALLESTKTYVTGLGQMSVIYRTSDESFAKAYEQIKVMFPGVMFLQQGQNPHDDFKLLTLQVSFVSSPNEYVLFAVDDDIVKDYINIEECTQSLEQTGAYGFYLRQGLNLRECYSMQASQPLPHYKLINNHVIIWNFSDGLYDWAYPNMLDMAIYRKSDIKNDFYSLNFYSPNRLEGQWHGQAAKIMKRAGLCYTQTKIVNIPLNQVQLDWSNVHMNYLSSKQLLEVFNQNKKIDIKPFFQIQNSAGHMEYTPKFISR